MPGKMEHLWVTEKQSQGPFTSEPKVKGPGLLASRALLTRLLAFTRGHWSIPKPKLPLGPTFQLHESNSITVCPPHRKEALGSAPHPLPGKNSQDLSRGRAGARRATSDHTKPLTPRGSGSLGPMLANWSLGTWKASEAPLFTFGETEAPGV